MESEDLYTEQVFSPYLFIEKNYAYIVLHKLSGCEYQLYLTPDGRAVIIEIACPGFTAAEVNTGTLALAYSVGAVHNLRRKARFPFPEGRVYGGSPIPRAPTLLLPLPSYFGPLRS